MTIIRTHDDASFSPKAGKVFSRNRKIECLFVLAALCLIAPHVANSQEMVSSTMAAISFIDEDWAGIPGTTGTGPMMAAFSGTSKKPKEHVESELIYEGLVSYGNWQIFAHGYDCKLYTAGLEYDRHSWGQHVGAHFDYVAEVLPLVILKAPKKSDFYGDAIGPKRKIVPGIGFSPIGLRMQWRSEKKIKPYLEIKGGMLVFTQKALSPDATYENFSFNTGIGVQVRLTDRWGLRLGTFGDVHFSNAFITSSNPGLDVMNANVGVSYHFRP